VWAYHCIRDYVRFLNTTTRHAFRPGRRPLIGVHMDGNVQISRRLLVFIVLMNGFRDHGMLLDR